MCYFICDRMLQSISMLAWKPSVQAAAAIYLARKYFGYTDSWVRERKGRVMRRIKALRSLREWRSRSWLDVRPRSTVWLWSRISCMPARISIRAVGITIFITAFRIKANEVFVGKGIREWCGWEWKERMSGHWKWDMWREFVCTDRNLEEVVSRKTAFYIRSYFDKLHGFMWQYY